VPLAMPVAVAVAVRVVFPLWVVVPAMLVHPLLTVEKHTSYDATPLTLSDPTFHDPDSAVVLFVQVRSLLNVVDRSKMLPCVGFVGAPVSTVNPLEHCHAATFPALSRVRTHV
jgi:hypothetical protein